MWENYYLNDYTYAQYPCCSNHAEKSFELVNCKSKMVAPQHLKNNRIFQTLATLFSNHQNNIKYQ